MEFIVKETDEDTLFRLVLGTVVPRPIGWVSTVSREGVNNVAPFSFFNAVNDSPPVFMVSISDRDDGTLKDTVKNILETEEFVINLVSEELFEAMLKTSEDYPPEVDEFKMANVTPQKGKLVKAPRVKEAKVCFECRLFKYERVYDMHLILGEALLVYVNDEIADREGRIDYLKYKPIGRLGGRYYVRISKNSIIEV